MFRFGTVFIPKSKQPTQKYNHVYAYYDSDPAYSSEAGLTLLGGHLDPVGIAVGLPVQGTSIRTVTPGPTQTL
jgi:hypothetical protein